MKKMIFMAVASTVLCTTGLTGYSAYDNHKSNNSTLIMQNIEALTQSEIPQTGCIAKDGSSCPGLVTTVDGVTLIVSYPDRIKP
jgi:hypothetical protein